MTFEELQTEERNRQQQWQSSVVLRVGRMHIQRRGLRPTPPLRLTVDAARASILAIARTDWPSTMPRDISSRSAIVNAKRERCRASGMIPPLGLKCPKMQEDGLPKARRSISGLHLRLLEPRRRLEVPYFVDFSCCWLSARRKRQRSKASHHRDELAPPQFRSPRLRCGQTLILATDPV
jgi:hypothetical protein